MNIGDFSSIRQINQRYRLFTPLKYLKKAKFIKIKMVVLEI